MIVYVFLQRHFIRGHALRGGEGLAWRASRFDARRQALRRRSRPCASSRSRSPTASSWCWSGPSGSGKTTALRMLAGLESITAGEIRIGERVVNKRRPARARHRDGLPGLRAVPADDGLRQPRLRAAAAQGAARTRSTRRVRRAAASLEHRRAAGAQARASSPAARRSASRSGRALVRDPQVFLMDEPLSNLDAKLRAQTRGEIKRLQQEVGTTTVYVTHDQVEAMTMGDRIAVMNDGVLEQVGTPEELYERPANRSSPASSARPAMSFFDAARTPTATACGCAPEPRPARPRTRLPPMTSACGPEHARAVARRRRPARPARAARSSTSRRSGARRSSAWRPTARGWSSSTTGRADRAGRRPDRVRARAGRRCASSTPTSGAAIA